MNRKIEIKVTAVNDGKPSRVERSEDEHGNIMFSVTHPKEVGIKHSVDFSDFYRSCETYNNSNSDNDKYFIIP